AVWAELHLDRTEPRVVATQEIRLPDRFWCRAVPLEFVAVDALRDGISVEQIAAELLRKLVVGVVGNAGDGAGAVVVIRDARGEAEAIVLLADPFVVAAAQEHVDGLRM